jgi:hypothetical protein
MVMTACGKLSGGLQAAQTAVEPMAREHLYVKSFSRTTRKMGG